MVSFASGNILEVELNIEKGRITKSEILGNCIRKENISKLENKLINIPHHKESLISELKSIDLNDYFFNLKLEELIKAIF